MTEVALSLLAHTNVGKTTLARTLLAADVGEVRDAPHVTEFATRHELVVTPAGDRLLLWDTPGFGDSVRLVRRMRQRAQPLGWLLGEVWDRWRDRAFWASQQALRHVREASDVVLYLVNAGEPAAGYLAAEMELLAWLGKPVVVLLNQLGAPRAPADEAAERDAWRERLARWPAAAQVREVLPLDAFARCWVQEGALLDAVACALDGERAAAMVRLAAAHAAQGEARFVEATRLVAQDIGRIAAARVALDGDAAAPGWGGLLRRLGTARDDAGDGAAQRLLEQALEREVRAGTQALLELHRIGGRADADALAEVLARVAGQVQPHRRLPEGRAAVLGGALSGALGGLGADLASGGLTLGGGLLAGGILGALGAAGLARGLNVVRGTDRSWARWDAEAMPAIVEAALLRYLAVAHFGRGRGDWAPGEAAPHWPAALRAALAPHAPALAALWRGRSERSEAADEAERLAAALQPVVEEALRSTLRRLYPPRDNPAP